MILEARLTGQLPQPTTEAAILAGIVLLALLIAVLLITIGESVYQRRQDLRRERARSDVEMALLTRMSEPDPEWNSWAEELTTAEQWVARDLIAEYLRTVEGSEKRALQNLAYEMGIVSEAIETLDSGARHERLQALSWLVLTETAVKPERLKATCTEDSDLRAAAARVLFAADHPDAVEAGTELLLGDGSLTLSVYGLDTLYQLYREVPERLLEYGSHNADQWRSSLVVQVLSVIEHCGLTAQAGDWEWVFRYTDNEAPSVRAAAVRALSLPGWDPKFRQRVDAERLVTDPHRNVRRAAYQMLAEWGDKESIELLAAGAVRESDQRSRLQALDALAETTELTDEILLAAQERSLNSARQSVVAEETAAVGDVPTLGDEQTVELDSSAETQDTETEVAADVKIGSGDTVSKDDDRAYQRAVAWVRARREVATE